MKHRFPNFNQGSITLKNNNTYFFLTPKKLNFIIIQIKSGNLTIPHKHFTNPGINFVADFENI